MGSYPIMVISAWFTDTGKTFWVPILNEWWDRIRGKSKNQKNKSQENSNGQAIKSRITSSTTLHAIDNNNGPKGANAISPVEITQVSNVLFDKVQNENDEFCFKRIFLIQKIGDKFIFTKSQPINLQKKRNGDSGTSTQPNTDRQGSPESSPKDVKLANPINQNNEIIHSKKEDPSQNSQGHTNSSFQLGESRQNNESLENSARHNENPEKNMKQIVKMIM